MKLKSLLNTISILALGAFVAIPALLFATNPPPDIKPAAPAIIDNHDGTYSAVVVAVIVTPTPTTTNTPTPTPTDTATPTPTP